MVSRIGDAAQFARMMLAVRDLQARIQDGQIAAATGRAARRFADIPDKAAQGLSLGHDLRLVEARIGENRRALGRIQVAEGAMAAISDVAERARNLLVQRLDASTGGSVPFVAEIDGMLTEIESRLNLRFDDRYLFAGSKTDTRPVSIPQPPPTSADPAAYYSGDLLAPRVRAEEGMEIVYLPTAADDAFASLIGALGAARQAHLAGDRAGLEAAFDDLGQAIRRLADLRGEFGARAARLESVVESQESTKLYLGELLHDIEDADLPAVVSRLAEDQAALEASYLTIARLARLSLTDFLR
jgi:flagellar hook-associated protein 3 FlgL